MGGSATLGLTEYYVQLVNERTGRPLTDSTGSYQVYTAGSPSRVTIKDKTGATITQATAVAAGKGNKFVSASLSSGVIQFFTASSVTSVDISILTTGGRAYFLEGVTPSQHRIAVNPEKQEYILVVAVDEKGSSTTVRANGFQLRRGMAITDVFVKVVTAWSASTAAAKSLDLGRSAAPQGMAKGLKVSTTGFKQMPINSTTGTIVAGQVIGTDLRTMKTGNATNFGWLYRKRYIPRTGVASNNLTFTRGAAATATFTAAAGNGYVFYLYDLLPTNNGQ